MLGLLDLMSALETLHQGGASQHFLNSFGSGVVLFRDTVLLWYKNATRRTIQTGHEKNFVFCHVEHALATPVQLPVSMLMHGKMRLEAKHARDDQ
jgi:hypothetical protein